MAKTKVEKIASIEEQIKQLKERQKQLKQQHNLQERKDRTKRLCKRMGLFESMLPDTIPLTEEQFKTFLEKTIITEHSRRILDGLLAQNAATAAPQATGAAAGAGQCRAHRQTHRNGTVERRERKREQGQRRKAERLTHSPLFSKGTLIHRSGVVRLAGGFCTYWCKVGERHYPRPLRT